VAGNDVGGRPKGVWPEKMQKFDKYLTKLNNSQFFRY
jgi:hypothetical protein